jgi:hypothetical protein
MALGSTALGAAALSIGSILCVSGDYFNFGDHPDAKGVFDIDSMQLIRMVKTMRDEGKFACGEDIDEPPRMFIGAAANPFADPFEFRVRRLAKKVSAGADFIQTQCIYNMEKFREFVRRALDMGLLQNVFLLAGVTPLKSVGMARYMQNDVPDTVGIGREDVALHSQAIAIAANHLVIRLQAFLDGDQGSAPTRHPDPGGLVVGNIDGIHSAFQISGFFADLCSIGSAGRTEFAGKCELSCSEYPFEIATGFKHPLPLKQNVTPGSSRQAA